MDRLNSLFHKRALVLLTVPLMLGSAVAGERHSGDTAPRRAPSAEELGLPSPEALATDLLAQFERIYNARDAEAYVAMFDPWIFSYEFSPLDKSWGAPEAWDYAEEVRTAQRMFADPKTTLIDLRLVQEEVSAVSFADALPTDQEIDRVWKVTAAAFLEVERKTVDGSTEHYRIRGQLHEFYFRRGTEDEGRAWRIVYWRDMTGREPSFTLHEMRTPD